MELENNIKYIESNNGTWMPHENYEDYINKKNYKGGWEYFLENGDFAKYWIKNNNNIYYFDDICGIAFYDKNCKYDQKKKVYICSTYFIINDKKYFFDSKAKLLINVNILYMNKKYKLNNNGQIIK